MSLQALSEARCGLSVEEPLHLVYILQPEPAEFPAIHCWSAWHSLFCSLPASQRVVASRLGIEERCAHTSPSFYPVAAHAFRGPCGSLLATSIRHVAHPD